MEGHGSQAIEIFRGRHRGKTVESILIGRFGDVGSEAERGTNRAVDTVDYVLCPRPLLRFLGFDFLLERRLEGFLVSTDIIELSATIWDSYAAYAVPD